MRPLRFSPPGALVEITTRTVQSRFLLRPSVRANELVVGVLGRAQRRYGMSIQGLVFLSNHSHLVLSPDSPQQLAAYMEYVNGNVARELARLHGWHDKVWATRYKAIPVSDEEEAQVARLLYVLAHGVKEGLVERPQDWPGVHCAQALLDGTALEGTWIDRTAEYESRRKREDRPATDFAHPETVVFTPLPCWAHFDPLAYRARIAELIDRVIEDGRRARKSRSPLGRDRILRQHPHERPAHSQRSPAPAVHAATQAIRLMLKAAYREFVDAYRDAAERLRAGDRLVVFPPRAFPPPLPCAVPTG